MYGVLNRLLDGKGSIEISTAFDMWYVGFVWDTGVVLLARSWHDQISLIPQGKWRKLIKTQTF